LVNIDRRGMLLRLEEVVIDGESLRGASQTGVFDDGPYVLVRER
jgi:hypothetical protein